MNYPIVIYPGDECGFVAEIPASYFYETTGNVSAAVIKKYIEDPHHK